MSSVNHLRSFFYLKTYN